MIIKLVRTKLEICLVIVLLFILSVANAQKAEKDVYFLFDKNDTLTRKIHDSSTGLHSGYGVINKKRIKKLNRTPLVEGKVWVPESLDDSYSFGPHFSFDKNNDSIITQKQLDNLKIIRDRQEFVIIENLLFDYNIFFIEPNKADCNYILRRVYPIFAE